MDEHHGATCICITCMMPDEFNETFPGEKQDDYMIAPMGKPVAVLWLASSAKSNSISQASVRQASLSSASTKRPLSLVGHKSKTLKKQATMVLDTDKALLAELKEKQFTEEMQYRKEEIGT